MNTVTINFHNRTANYGFNVRVIKNGVTDRRKGGHYPCAGSAAAAAVNLAAWVGAPYCIIGPQDVLNFIPQDARSK